MAFSYTLKDWMKLSEDALGLGTEVLRLIKTIISLLRQGANLGKDLWNLGAEILYLAQDMIRNPQNRPSFISTMLKDLMRRFIFQAQK